MFEFAGRIRDYDITKKEWVLDGDTVHYGAVYRLMETLAFDFGQERKFSYVGISDDELIGALREVVRPSAAVRRGLQGGLKVYGTLAGTGVANHRGGLVRCNRL